MSLWGAGRLLTVLAAAATGAFGQESIRGTFTMRLSSPVNQEISARAKAGARANLRSALAAWLEESRSFVWDTTNAIHRIHLDTLTGICIAKATASSKFDGPKWSYIYTVTPEQAASAIEEHNTRCDTLAQRAYAIFKKSVQEGQTARTYVLGIRTIFFAEGHVGAALRDPDSEARLVVEEARIALGPVMKRMVIGGPNLIIEGKPGFKAPADQYLEVKLDTMVVPGLSLALILPNGKRLLSAQTDVSGRISLAELIIPYVPNGSYCYVRPDIGRLIASSYVFSAADLGIPGSTNPEQTLLFKITRPVVALRYRAAAVNNITLPRDFADPAKFARFLSDSCALDVQPGATAADLIMDVNCQASSYYHDDTEETSLKAEAVIQIEERAGVLKRIKSQDFNYEKAYGKDQGVPVGLFLWEVSALLTKTVKGVLESW